MAKSDSPAASFLASTELASQNKSPEQGDAFWTHEEIDAARWNQAFPFQFLIVRAGKNGSFVQDAEAKKWVFTLPFPPSSLSIGMPFAVAGSVTQGGYVEEYNAAPIRTISLSGSLGVLPLRPTSQTVKTVDMGAAIFAGTIQQGQRVATSAKNLVSDITGQNPNFAPNLVDASIFDNADADTSHVAKTSGYYQLRTLEEFFENFAAWPLLRGRSSPSTSSRP